MSPAFIKFQLEEKKQSLTRIAGECNCSISYVSKVIHRRKKSEKVEKVIAQVIGKPRHEVFPVCA